MGFDPVEELGVLIMQIAEGFQIAVESLDDSIIGRQLDVALS